MLTWEPGELLADRPVQRGQVLISVADLGGPWILELNVSDRRIGHLLSTLAEDDRPLPVTFTLSTGNAESYEGVVAQVSRRTEVINEDHAATRVLVTVPDAAKTILRPGATVSAKIDCGKRSLGFVWFHEIVETIRMWVFF